MGELILLFFFRVFRVITINSPWGKTHLITIVGTCVVVILIAVVISRMKKDNQEINIPQEPKVKAVIIQSEKDFTERDIGKPLFKYFVAPLIIVFLLLVIAAKISGA